MRSSSWDVKAFVCMVSSGGLFGTLHYTIGSNGSQGDRLRGRLTWSDGCPRSPHLSGGRAGTPGAPLLIHGHNVLCSDQLIMLGRTLLQLRQEYSLRNCGSEPAMQTFDEHFEVVVVGAGHAGCEAAMATARMGLKTALFTLNVDLIAQMSCNPAIGGIAKGHLVREVDALGGIMGEITDAVGIQFRLLNTSRGPAVWSPRAQCDKQAYRLKMRQVLESEPNLRIRQAEVADLVIEETWGLGDSETGRPTPQLPESPSPQASCSKSSASSASSAVKICSGILLRD